MKVRKLRRRYGRALSQSVYQRLRAIGVELDHHESDLYVRATPEAVRIVKEYAHRFSYFTDARSGEQWIDIPFAYDPWWERKTRR